MLDGASGSIVSPGMQCDVSGMRDGDHGRHAMSIRCAGYWLITGALTGSSLLGVLSFGFPFVILGVILVAVGLIWMRGAEWWTALVGFGGVPAVLLLLEVTSRPWACISGPVTGGRPNVGYYTCVETPVGPLTIYHIMAIVFGAIALAGLVWALWRAHVTRARRAAT